MNDNLIERLSEEWANLDPVDPLRGLIRDAIAALSEARAAIERQSAAPQPLTVAGGAVFQDAEGKRPVTAIGQPVGRWEPTPLYPPGGAGVFLERPQAQPLTHLQAKALVEKYGNDPLHLIFQTEAAHGITKGTT